MPGINDEDLKAMQKPPMRSFDPAILQERAKLWETGILVQISSKELFTLRLAFFHSRIPV